MTKILIVDDEAKIREVIKEYIEFSGYESDEAEDGKEAVEKCRDNNYDLIIMDIMMPEGGRYHRHQRDQKILRYSYPRAFCPDRGV